MKKQLIIGLLPFSILLSTASHAENTSLENKAQSLAQLFQSQLKPELKKALKQGGPVNAIKVCNSKAPQIAHDLAQKSGWEINRVSLKARAENAKPDPWESDVLVSFNEKLAQGADIKGLQYSETIQKDGKSTFRYMKAIPTGEVCLKCHGTSLTTSVKQALHNLYPNDQATGFSKGQIRGAFSFQKSL